MPFDVRAHAAGEECDDSHLVRDYRLYKMDVTHVYDCDPFQPHMVERAYAYIALSTGETEECYIITRWSDGNLVDDDCVPLDEDRAEVVTTIDGLYPSEVKRAFTEWVEKL